MNDRKTRRAVPAVEVIRRPASTPGSAAQTPSPSEPAPTAPTPRPTPRPTAGTASAPIAPTPRPTGVAPTPRPAAPAAPAGLRLPPRLVPSARSPAPAPRTVTPGVRPPAPRAPGGPGASGPRPGGFGGRPGGFRPSTPRPPPTPEQILALAQREHVPARIAKGELEGKMKCRIWRKLHAEEAKRFDQVYELMGQTPSLSLGDAFGVLQSGMTVAEFMARKERTQRKAAIKQARGEVDNAVVAELLGGLISGKVEVSVVLAERSLLDTLVAEEPIAFTLERTGRLEKLQVVLLARRAEWDRLLPGLERDAKLTQKPATVARQPDKRPYSDPRAFLDHLGQMVKLVLRNGITLQLPLMHVGRFDLLLGETGHEVFVPLHALLRFEPVTQSAPAEGA
ncbi:hypothetical protein MYSTI_06386 [Myxococcus stipitatus DSM 14675]|uniref:Uncharacterized protein n=1 Tax=Myxococcus stipitatus (strain DSM 14675 / JCM 12634 / Mx s8) TaxID=1278073 RepID=L7UMF6_MYXSD|nr:hypothetical protein MYSTI_06386 [Myxococcus stipitatus DSM 14675]